MSRPIRISNPIPGGASFTSISRAQNYVRNNLAIMIKGELCFRIESRPNKTVEREIEDNRGGMIYWNGSLEYYIPGTDHGTAMYPPGRNVLFPKPGTQRARQRYGLFRSGGYLS